MNENKKVAKILYDVARLCVLGEFGEGKDFEIGEALAEIQSRCRDKGIDFNMMLSRED